MSLDENGRKIYLDKESLIPSPEKSSIQYQASSNNKSLKYFNHPSAVIDEGVNIGIGTKIWHFSHILSGSKIGEQCNIGQNVVIGPDVTIGNFCGI